MPSHGCITPTPRASAPTEQSPSVHSEGLSFKQPAVHFSAVIPPHVRDAALQAGQRPARSFRGGSSALGAAPPVPTRGSCHRGGFCNPCVRARCSPAGWPVCCCSSSRRHPVTAPTSALCWVLSGEGGSGATSVALRLRGSKPSLLCPGCAGLEPPPSALGPTFTPS